MGIPIGHWCPKIRSWAQIIGTARSYICFRGVFQTAAGILEPHTCGTCVPLVLPVLSAVCSLAQQTSTMTVSTRSSCRPVRRSTMATASGIAVALCLVAAAESFIVPARAMPVARRLKTSSPTGSISASIDPAGSCHSFSIRGGGTLKPGSTGRKALDCMAAAVDRAASTVGDVGLLGANEGVLSEEQKRMASTLLELGQVWGVGPVGLGFVAVGQLLARCCVIALTMLVALVCGTRS